MLSSHFWLMSEFRNNQIIFRLCFAFSIRPIDDYKQHKQDQANYVRQFAVRAYFMQYYHLNVVQIDDCWHAQRSNAYSNQRSGSNSIRAYQS
jgi:hypothetical protein